MAVAKEDDLPRPATGTVRKSEYATAPAFVSDDVKRSTFDPTVRTHNKENFLTLFQRMFQVVKLRRN